MSFPGLMTHIMDVYTSTKTIQTNGTYNNVLTIKLSNQPCRLEKESGGEIDKNDANKYASTYMLFCKPLNIIEHDKITVDSVSYNIRYIEKCYNSKDFDHMEIILEKSL